VAAVKAMGYEDVLLVSGEANQAVGVDYFVRALDTIRPHVAQVSLEVQPLETADYERLMAHGLHTVLVYQETYHQEDYQLHHPKGKKANFRYRLETPDRLGAAGLHKMGLGVLIGLEDWRTDGWFTALHLRYLEQTYWKTKYSLSFPRLRPHASAGERKLANVPEPAKGTNEGRAGGSGRSSLPEASAKFSSGTGVGITGGILEPKVSQTDRELVQLICAYRLLNEEVELSLSTRESPLFRTNAVRLGVTAMSAGSRTNPGGYAVDTGSLEQFEIHDQRSPVAIAEMIRGQGYDVVWKDWDSVLQKA
jgi:2-iminoacetate synthase